MRRTQVINMKLKKVIILLVPYRSQDFGPVPSLLHTLKKKKTVNEKYKNKPFYWN